MNHFKIEFKKLKDKIYKEATPKKYNGKRLNDDEMIEYYTNLVKEYKMFARKSIF